MRKSSNVEAAFAMPNAAKKLGHGLLDERQTLAHFRVVQVCDLRNVHNSNSHQNGEHDGNAAQAASEKGANHERPPFDDAAEGESNAADAADASPSQCLPSASAP